MSVQPIIQFSGRIDCRRDGCGPLGLIMSGHTALHPRQLVHLCFAGTAPPDLPRSLDGAAVAQVGEESYCITSDASSWTLSARAAHLHREVTREFYAAVPGEPVRWTQRLFWRIVLTLAATSAGRWLLGVWRRG
jgi:hypothetical protein